MVAPTGIFFIVSPFWPGEIITSADDRYVSRSGIAFVVSAVGLAPDVPEGGRGLALGAVLQHRQMGVPATGNIHHVAAIRNLAVGEGEADLVVRRIAFLAQDEFNP